MVKNNNNINNNDKLNKHRIRSRSTRSLELPNTEYKLSTSTTLKAIKESILNEQGKTRMRSMGERVKQVTTNHKEEIGELEELNINL